MSFLYFWNAAVDCFLPKIKTSRKATLQSFPYFPCRTLGKTHISSFNHAEKRESFSYKVASHGEREVGDGFDQSPEARISQRQRQRQSGFCRSLFLLSFRLRAHRHRSPCLQPLWPHLCFHRYLPNSIKAVFFLEINGYKFLKLIGFGLFLFGCRWSGYSGLERAWRPVRLHLREPGKGFEEGARQVSCNGGKIACLLCFDWWVF